MEVGYSLKPVAASTRTLQHHTLYGLPPKPTPKPTPHLHRCITVRVAPYAHTQHIKVPKGFVYIQYGCGIQSEACSSLNNDITTSYRLRSTLKSQNSTPDLQRGASL